MSFASPWLLASLAVVPVAVAAYAWAQRRVSRYAVRFPNVAVLAAVSDRRSSWRRHVPAALLAVALAALCVSLARPHVTLASVRDDATVVLVVDVSGSMRADDVEPTRLGAAQAAMERFLQAAPGKLRIGIVSFSEQAEVAVPPTHDRELLRNGIALLFTQRGTAVGDAIDRAVELARAATEVDGAGEEAPAPAPAPASGDAEAPVATIVLLSDGAQTAGFVSAAEGARRAAEAGFPVYTIALGTDEGRVIITRWGETREIPVPPDRTSLAAIAEATGGEYTDAPDAETLSKAYARLGSRLGRTEQPEEVTAALVLAGALAAAGAALAGLLWRPVLP